MLVDSAHDTLVFGASFVCGQIIGLLFDFFRSFRKNVKVSKSVLSLQDSIFCALSFYIFYKTVYITNSGDIRWYVIAGACLGTILYFSAESAFVMKIMVFLWKWILKTAAFLRWGTGKIVTPFCRAYSRVKKALKHTFSKALGIFRRKFIKKKVKSPKNSR